ncbi:hypothetical protein HYALB_00006721 [Hymenoscyphus albidus]|uniref:Protein-ribulosamine 3-kinase n=1 Tax=Hymenoscyphus albidus TaxID=595503 RepID=A0A9N9LRN0_9HELO|nr:hypothetical protein HYALB_00006721 [Hymenoscyphus albidus]
MPSPSQVDAAILEALDLEPETSRMVSHGGSGFSGTSKVLGFVRGGGGGDERGEGEEKEFFVKIGKGEGSWEVMFAGEHQSLNAIHTAVPSLCPKSYGHGTLKSGGHFLATDFLDLSRSTSSTSNAQSTNLSLA